MYELEQDEFLRLLFVIFGKFNPSDQPEETPEGKARFWAVQSVALFKKFSQHATVLETDFPKPSPKRLPALRETLSRFEEDLNVVENNFETEVKKSAARLSADVHKVAIIGVSDASAAERQGNELNWFESLPLNHLERSQLILEAVRDGDELLVLSVLSCGVTRQKRLFGEQMIGNKSIIETIKEKWFGSKMDQTKKQRLAKLNSIIVQVVELFGKLRSDAKARAEMAPSLEDQMRARLTRLSDENKGGEEDRSILS
jgi:hypothetical protein